MQTAEERRLKFMDGGEIILSTPNPISHFRT
jgi:hypothetical protein